MRYSLYVFLLMALAICQLVGCQTKRNNTVKISISYPKAAGDTVLVARTNLINLDSIGLGRVVLDSAGKGIVAFEVDTPVFVGISAGHLATGLLLSPGDQLSLVASKPGAKNALAFEGDDAAAQEFMQDAEQFRREMDRWKGVYSFQLEKDDFLIVKDSLQRGYDQLLAKLNSNPNVTNEKRDLLARRTNASILFYQYNFSNGRDSAEIPSSVWEATKKLPADTSALKAGLFDFGLIASFYYRQKIYDTIYKENEEMDVDSLDAMFPFLIEKKIKSYKFPKMIEDFLRVKSANDQIAMSGLAPSILKVAGALEKEITNEEYKKVIREDIGRWEKLAPGKPAPDFAGTTPDGKNISLSDLRGKVVYVDIWATWCGPCVGEFPHSKKVQADFKDNDQVTFLYVSTDRDTLAWKKMVASGRVPHGIHILDNSDSSNSVWTLYHVWGIPRYLLIDADGRMVAAHADRPSSGKVQVELRKLLTKSRVAQN